MWIFTLKRGWDKSPSLSIVFGLSSKTQWLSGLYYADFISFYSPTQLCGGGTTKSNSNELPISVPLSKKTDAYYACALPPDQTTMENDSAAAMTDGSSAQDDLPTVTVSKSDLGELLDDREPTEVKPGVCRYLLTRQEFEDLAAKLADRGVTLKTEDTDSDQIWLEMLDE